jgi:DNA/RNA-binding domain of Phe-tRNA-synthetase-like protein
MYFSHSSDIWTDFPELVPGVLAADGITNDAAVDRQVEHYGAVAESRLAMGTESDLPEIQAWRRTFSKMGLKPTQYRCASESLLRRFRKEGSVPRIHPLIDLCNAVSIAFAIPVAVFDVSMIEEFLEVRHATGSEVYSTFAGGAETPEPGEVIFADRAGRAHARRWTNRQSSHAAVRDDTTSVLIVAEAMHESAGADIERLVASLADEITAIWSTSPVPRILGQSSPRFEF